MGEHGWFDKRFMYEESMHTPLIMRLPKGFDRRGDITEMVQNIDYAPTFLELAGVEVPEDMHGISLLPLLKGGHPTDWRTANELHNLYGQSEYDSIVNNLKKQMLELQEEYNDPVRFSPDRDKQ